MRQRRAASYDVAHAIMASTAVHPDRHRLHRFRLSGGTDRNGDTLSVVIDIRRHVVTVVTVMGDSSPAAARAKDADYGPLLPRV